MPKDKTSAKNRKRVVLTTEQRIELLDSHKGGASHSSLAAKYGIGKATVTDIKSKEAEILEFCSKVGDQTRKTTKGYDHLDTAIINWFSLKRSQNVTLQGSMIREIALRYNQRLGDRKKKDFVVCNFHHLSCVLYTINFINCKNSRHRRDGWIASRSGME